MKLKSKASILLLLLVCIPFTFVSCSEKGYKFPEVVIPPEYFTNSSYNLENLVDTDIVKNDIETIYELENGGRAVRVHIMEKNGVRYYTLDTYCIVVDKNGKCISDIRYTFIERNYKGDALICMLELNDEHGDSYDVNAYYENLIVDIRTAADGSLLNTFTNSRIFCDMYDYSFVHLYMGNGIYKQGLLDKNFNLILDPVYDGILYCNDIQKFAFFKDGKWFFGNEKGQKLTSQIYDTVIYHSPFTGRSPLILVYRDGKYGFVNGDTLEEEIPLIYDLAGSFDFLSHSAYMVLGDEIFIIDKYGNRIKSGMFPDCEDEDKIRQYVSDLWYVTKTHPAETVISKDDFRFDLGGYMMYSDNFLSLDMMQTYLSYESGNDREYYTYEKIKEIGLYEYNEEYDKYYIYSYQNQVTYDIEYVFKDISEIGENLYELRAVPFVIEEDIFNDKSVSYLIGADGKKYESEEFISKREFEEKAAVLENECGANPYKYRIYTFTVRITDGGFIYLEDAVMS